MSPDSVWEVAVPVPLRRTFLYAVPGEFGAPAPGARVLVPFGRRRVTGYLIGEATGDPDPSFKIKSVIELLDETPSFPRELLDFLVEAAAYYLHPIGEALRAALPPGIDPSEKAGALRGPRVKQRTERIAVATETAAGAIEQMSRRAPRRAAVLQQVVERGAVAVEELRALHRRAAAHVRRLADDDMIVVEQRERPPDPFLWPAVESDEPPQPSAEQQAAVSSIEGGLDQRGIYRGFLLHGVTGSGKTEVYLRAIERATEHGRGALVLVPEIALTPQLVHRYRARFGDAVAIWHSGLTDRERYDQWQLLLSGRVRVAVGVRSAVFAPVRDLGIVVVDEEHDGSFKQERGFAYQARDLALLRASRAGAVAVLGSATPSLETHHNAAIGKLERLELKARVTDLPLPRVEIVDRTSHRGGPGGQEVFSGPLHEAIGETLERGEQAILFLNRRGFAPTMICSSCGEVHRCDDCAVSLTYHRRPQGLVCHYCGARRPVPERCPSCASTELKPMGAGTQKAEQVLTQLFPEARVARLDRDVASGRSVEAVLDRLRKGEVDILVGTQMVTKGHDFPRVTLVGVLNADVGLHMPDFRAAERTFQLLTQVAGRAGRSELGGRALIQTYSPSHPAIQLASGHDFESFAAYESEAREELGYPPFGRLAALRLSGTDPGRVERAARDLFVQLREEQSRQSKRLVTLLGPAPAPIPLVQNRHRWRILLRAQRQDRIRRLLAAIVPTVESTSSGVRVRIDVDPVSML
ncbi:MAG: primosomal protein N' [Deltaproteobacteria bacterium]|nr:primosomal protein N' [Deltaproteobacteria bacterium]